MTEQPVSRFNAYLVPIKQGLEEAKSDLSEREWTSLMDILARYADSELRAVDDGNWVVGLRRQHTYRADGDTPELEREVA